MPDCLASDVQQRSGQESADAADVDPGGVAQPPISHPNRDAPDLLNNVILNTCV